MKHSMAMAEPLIGLNRCTWSRMFRPVAVIVVSVRKELPFKICPIPEEKMIKILAP